MLPRGRFHSISDDHLIEGRPATFLDTTTTTTRSASSAVVDKAKAAEVKGNWRRYWLSKDVYYDVLCYAGAPDEDVDNDYDKMRFTASFLLWLCFIVEFMTILFDVFNVLLDGEEEEDHL